MCDDERELVQDEIGHGCAEGFDAVKITVTYESEDGKDRGENDYPLQNCD
jgi:hypothetical protein